ncbi:MAG: VPLPA-CTERM sorting domain-containing protein [Parvularculaceae bacterium]
MKLLISAAVAAVVATGAASASSIYTVAGSSDLVSNNGSYQVYEDNGIQMKLSAGLFTDTAVTGDAVVTPGQYGARPVPYSPGTGITHNNNDGQHTVDSNYPEVAIMLFDTAVQLTGVWLSYVDPSDTFDLFIDTDNDGILERIEQNLALPDSSVAFVDLLAYNLVGKLFGIGASGYESCKEVYSAQKRKYVTKCETIYSDWKLKKVVFEEVSDVPLPAALPLFMAGLAGFGFATRKKRA